MGEGNKGTTEHGTREITGLAKYILHRNVLNDMFYRVYQGAATVLNFPLWMNSLSGQTSMWHEFGAFRLAF